MADTGWHNPRRGLNISGWTRPGDVVSSNNVYATSTVVTSTMTADDFRFFTFSVSPLYRVFTGISVQIEAKATGIGPGCTLRVHLSWDGGSSYAPLLGTATWTGLEEYKILTVFEPTGAHNQMPWGRKWIESEFSRANFYARITLHALSGISPQANVDHLQVKLFYEEVRQVGTPGAIVFDEDRIVSMG